MLIDDRGNARWLAIGGLILMASACAACALLTILLTGAYGGQTVRLRNPFNAAQPTFIAQPATTTDGTTSTTTTGSGTTGGSSGGASTTTTGSGTTGSSSGGASTTTTGGNSVANTGSAAAYLPTLIGFTTANASTIEGAFNLVAAQGGFGAQSDPNAFSAQSLGLGELATSILISRIDDFIACYRNTGAVDAQIYIQSNLSAIVSGEIPPVGAVVVVNEDRLRESLIACAVSPNDPSAFSAQSDNQPCGNVGSFTANGQRFTYLYAGSSSAFCAPVASHFARLGG